MSNEEEKQVAQARFLAWSRLQKAKHIGAFLAVLCGWAVNHIWGGWFSVVCTAIGVYLLTTYKFKLATVKADHKYEEFHAKRGI